jgi:hypothetical protein
MTPYEALTQAAEICLKPRIWDAARGMVSVVAQCREAADEIRALRDALPQPTASEAGELEWLHRFINCVPFGEHAPQADIDRAHRIVDALHASSPAAPEEK